jgi:hypothetical protein
MVVTLLAPDLHLTLIMPCIAGGLQEILWKQLLLLVKVIARSLSR